VWQCGCGCFSNSFSCRNVCHDVFLFFKNHFWYQHIKTIQKVQTALNFSKKKKNSNLDEIQVQTQYQTFSRASLGDVANGQIGKSKWKWSEFHWEVSELNHRMISLLALDLITGWLVSYTSNHILTSGMIYLLYQAKKWIFAIISFFFPCVLVRAKVMFIYLFLNKKPRWLNNGNILSKLFILKI